MSNTAVILVLGSGGQVGRELMRIPLPYGMKRRGLTHGELDITDREAVAAAVREVGTDLVVNAAAYTAVDKAESEPERAFAVNCGGATNVADACATAGAALVHLSTDYVFDGEKDGAYVEDDLVHPLCVYGASKAAGEASVRSACPRHVVLRTAWVYGVFGRNFVKTMLELAETRDEVAVVDDQRGCPTAAADIAAAILDIARAPAPRWGTYHYCGSDTSWYSFAQEIFDIAAPVTARRPALRAISTADYPTPARRPRNAVLDCARIGAAFGIRSRPWRDALRRVLDELLRERRVGEAT